VKTAQNLFFHYASAEPVQRRNTISREALAGRVRSELEAGRKISRLEDYLSSPPGPDRFTVSFDDAHVSVRDHAAPVLRELGVTATLFVPTAYVGSSEEFLSWDDLCALSESGWTIGSHSASHVRMARREYDEDEAAHRRRLSGECERSRDLIARRLGSVPSLFAYPYGEESALVRDVVRAAGYGAAFSVATDLDWDGDPFGIPRIDPEDVATRDDPTRISVVVPAFNRAEMLAEVVTRLARQSYPEDRHEVIVVDDGSDDDLSPIFEEMPPHIRLVREEGQPFRAGQARNRGAAEARYEALAFLDADVAVSEDYLWHLDWIHRRVEDAVILGYLSGYNLHDLGFVHTTSDLRQAGASLDALALIPDRSREPALRACLDNLDWLEEPWRLTYTGNLCVSRALFDRIGGFSDAFVGWGLEDIDLGYRLAAAGGAFALGRFATGYHMIDPSEDHARNPFRRKEPELTDFEGYLENLTILDMRHGEDPAMARYVASSRADIDETCGRPYTVGIEVGGAASMPSPFHRALHRVIPGGVPAHELFERVSYAEKIGARSIYILGGAPAEHPAFMSLLRRASAAVDRVAMLSQVYPFAKPGVAERAKDAGLDAVTSEVHGMSQEVHDAVFGEGRWHAFRAGLDALGRAGIERSAHVVVSPLTASHLEETLACLATESIRADDVTVTDASLRDAAALLSPAEVRLAPP